MNGSSKMSLMDGESEDKHLPVIPCVLGILYEGEEVRKCPLCAHRLMWYHLPKEDEMLACTNPKCDYPFDDSSPYEVRSRQHGKVCIEGTPAPPDDKLAIAGPAAGSSTSPEMNLQRYVPVPGMGEGYDKQYVNHYLMSFLSNPGGCREPEGEETPFIDYCALEGVMACMKAIDEQAAESVD